MFVVIGALVFSVLGAFWAVESIANWPGAPVWAYGLVAIPVIGLTALAATRLVSSRSLPRAADPAAARREGKRMGIVFGAVFTVEFGVIAVVAVWLDTAGHSLLIPVAVAFIVGAHFLPLARVFRLPFYYVTGLVCIACALGALLLPVESVRLLVLGLSVAAVLWTSALVVLLRHTGHSAAQPAPRADAES
jgi:hypothetical protein